MYNSLSPSFGSASQTSFQFGDLIQRELNFNADFTYPLDVGFFSPVTLSGGAEYRREEYEQTAGDLQSYAAGPFAVQNLFALQPNGTYLPAGQVTKPVGASGYGGTSPQAAGKYSQHNYALYAGAETDVTEKLSLGAMGRFEHYNTFGSAFVAKGNFLYKASDVVSLRGTVGTGFHAPSPGQNNVQILTTTFVGGDQVQVGTYPLSSAIAQYYGGTTLKPERSTNFGAGIVLQPMDSLNFTIDAYSISVRNRIGVSQNFTVTAADLVRQPALQAVGLGGAVNYFTNAFNTRTRGVDLVGTWHGDALGGRTNVTLAYSYNKSTVTKRDPNIISDSQVINIGALAPNHRANLTVNWNNNGWNVTVREAYYGSWREDVGYPNQLFGAKLTTDIDIAYTFKEHFTVSVGAINAFGAYPDKVANSPDNRIFLLTNSLADGQVYPNVGGPFGFNGGFYYAKLRIKY
jgi:iron complex outermembrane receptor protein